MNTTTIDKYGGTTAFIAQPRCEECLDSWLQVKPDVVCVGFGKKPSYPCFRSPNTVETADMTRDDFKLLADALREVEPKAVKANSAQAIQ
jgi:hypothetical protein